MPKYRQLHTKIIDSFDFNEMPDDFTRVVWLLLPVILDSEGRGIGSMAWVKSKMFPLREDINNEQLQSSFQWLVERGMVIFYEVGNYSYFYVPTFKTYQSGTHKEAKSVLPAPPDLLQSNSGVAPAQGSAAESASASESVIESESKITNIFKIYENEIGFLTPMISDELKEAEKEYPLEWFKPAFKEAVDHNARNWKYIHAILKRWKIEGFNSLKSPPEDPRNIATEVY